MAWTQTVVFPPESGIDPKVIQNWVSYLHLPAVVAAVIMPFLAWLVFGYNLIRMFRKKDCLSNFGLSTLQLLGVKIIIFLDPGHALGWIID
jgi:hypothetical protein